MYFNPLEQAIIDSVKDQFEKKFRDGYYDNKAITQNGPIESYLLWDIYDHYFTSFSKKSDKDLCQRFVDAIISMASWRTIWSEIYAVKYIYSLSDVQSVFTNTYYRWLKEVIAEDGCNSENLKDRIKNKLKNGIYDNLYSGKIMNTILESLLWSINWSEVYIYVTRDESTTSLNNFIIDRYCGAISNLIYMNSYSEEIRDHVQASLMNDYEKCEDSSELYGLLYYTFNNCVDINPKKLYEHFCQKYFKK